MHSLPTSNYLPILSKQFFLSLVFLAAISLVTGCFQNSEDENTAGVDDFPNAIYARVNENLGEAKGVQASATVPGEALRAIEIKSVGLPKDGNLKKVSAESQALLNSNGWYARYTLLKKSADLNLASEKTFQRSEGSFANKAIDFELKAFNLLDTTFIPFTISRTDLQGSLRETYYFRKGTDLSDSMARGLGLAAVRSERTFNDGSQEIGQFADADGDGTLFQPLKAAKIEMVLVKIKNGIAEIAEVKLDGGQDGNFDTENDNRIYKAQWRRASLNAQGQITDTLTLARYSVVDTNQVDTVSHSTAIPESINDTAVIIDNSKPSLVDLVFSVKRPDDNAKIATRFMKLRVIVRYKQEKQELRRFKSEEIYKDGKKNTATMKRPDGNLDLEPAGKTWVQWIISNTSAEDSVQSLEINAVIKPETVLGLDRDSLLSYYVTAKNRKGNESELRFKFDAATLVPPKGNPRDGSIELAITYSDGRKGHLQGTLKAGALTAEVLTPGGKIYQAAWNALGKLVKFELM